MCNIRSDVERGHTVDEASVTIAAAPERVWALVTDITRMGEWSPESTGGRWTRGATVRRCSPGSTHPSG